MFAFYTNYSLNLILILTILSSDKIVSAQEFFAANDKDLITAVPLNKCISKDSNSMIYKFFNGTHIIQKVFTGSTTCDESYVSAQYFIEGYYTDIQRLISNSVAYQMYSYDANCDVIYSYVFFREKECIEGLNNYFYSITVFNDKMIELNYHVTNEENICDFVHNSASNAMIYYDNQCIRDNSGRSIKVSINQDKVPHCEENATDSLGIALVFLFLCLILF